MRKLYLFFLVLSLSFFLKNVHATHALGGDLMYTQVGPNEFDVTLRIYRDCNGISLPNDVDIYWQGSCGSGSESADRISNIDITPLCPGLPTACQGGSGTIGIEEHIYTTTITVPAGCTDIMFDYTLCCRNHVITTLIDPGNENIYLSTSHLAVNTVLNNSPIFNNYPAPIVCVNQPVVYNHGVFDPDGDSLYFSPNNCYEANSDTVEYLPGFNGITPLITANPIQIHPNTGAITFTPTAQQVGVMCILVEEFRDGIKIGETLRDIQFNVIACANVPPVASGINNVPGVDSLDFVISVCESSQICFDLSFNDADNDNLSVSWNQEIPAATFQVYNNGTQTPTGTFCWLPQATDVGLNFFSINITDDACPLVGSSTYTYTVDVLPNPHTMSLDYNDLVCVGGTGNITLNASATPDSVYWAPNPTLTVVNDTFATVSPLFAQTYGAVAYFSGSCQLSDNAPIGISAPPTIQGNANMTDLCNGGTVILNGSGGSTYTWNNGVSDNVAFTPPVGVTDYIVTGTDSIGCTGMDTVQITVNPIIGINATPGGPLCYGDSLVLTGFGAQSYVWNNGVVDGVAFLPPSGTTTYILTGTDLNGCTATDSVSIFVNPLPIITATASQDSICLGDSVSLSASGASSYVWSNGQNNGDIVTPNAGNNSFSVVGTDAYGCENTANLNLWVHDLPTISISNSGNNVCAGDSISLTASGASTYAWSNGIANGQSFVPRIGVDTISVIGTDVNGCSSNNSLAITTLPLPAVVASTSGNNVCEGESISLSGSGAQSYTWNNGVIDGQSFVPPVGNTWYVVTGTDANSCMSLDSVEIIVKANPIVSVVSSANNVCENTTLSLSGSGASTYVWDNGVTDGQVFTPNVGTTTYTVIGTDGLGCTDTANIALTVFPLPILQITASDTEVCEGENISLNASGASAYLWSNGVSNGATFTPNVGINTYQVTATDANGCSAQDSIEVIVNALPNVQANALDSEICAGASATVYGSGAQSYVWDNGVSDNVAFYPNVGSTSYTVTGTDANGCSAQDNIAIQVNALPILNLSTSGNNICEGESISLSATGAQSYTWNNGVVNGLAFVPPVGLTNYVVNATDSNVCSNNDSIQIQVNALPIVTANASAQAVCDGNPVTLTGAGAQSYLWDNGVVDGVSFIPSAANSNFTVIGTDANGCVNNASIALTVYALPNVQANAVDNEICAGASATVYGSGAQSYVWDNGVSDNVAFYPNVGSASYTVTGTDANGCSAQDNIAIQVNALPILNLSTSGNNICEGESISLSATGAQSYTWNNGVVNGLAFVPPVGLTNYVVNATDSNVCSNNDSIQIQVNALPIVTANASAQAVCDGNPVTLTGAGAQSYVWDNGVVDGVSFIPSAANSNFTVIGTDANGCVNNASIALTVYALPNVQANAVDNEICAGASATVYASGAQSYVWDNGVSDNVAFYPNVGSTSYTVTGTDANGCSAQDNIAIQVNALPILNLSTSGNNICEGESISLSATGAQSYTWNNGVVNGLAFVPPVGLTNYVVNATDSNVCSNNDSIQIQVNALPVVTANASAQAVCDGNPVTLTGAGAQSYVWDNGVLDGVSFIPNAANSNFTVIGTDANGCVNNANIALTVHALPNVEANSISTQICAGNTATLFGSGAQSYVWDNGVSDNISFIPAVGTELYTVIGTDQNACSASDTISITTTVLPTPVITVSSSGNHICDGEFISLTASGAQSYAWNNGVVNGANFQAPVGLTTYTVNATDSNGCSQMDSIGIQVNPLPTVLINASAPAVCDGSSLTLNGAGAQSYVWNNGVQDGVSFIPNPAITNYQVTATDSNGCVNTADIQITVHALPNVEANASQAAVCDGAEMYLFGSGASSYVWDNGVVDGQDFNPPLGLNTYVVAGTDVNGCVDTDTIQILTNGLPTPGVTSSNNTVCEDESVTLTGSGGESYVWNNGVLDGISFIPPVGITSYVVCVYDTNGCAAHDSVQVTVHPKPVVGINYSATTICEGESATLAGTGAQSYVWTNGVIDGQAFTPPSGQPLYKMTGTSNFGCVNEDSITLNVNPLPVLQVATSPNIICEGNLVTLSASGADTYQWSNGVTNNVPFMPNPGLNTYHVVGTDLNGCEGQLSTNIMVNPLPDVGANSSDNNVCEGSSLVLIGSGAQSYTWTNNVVQGIAFVPPVGTTTYEVTGTNVHGCQNSDSIAITVLPNPTVLAIASDDVICEGEPTSLFAQGANTYTWSNGISNGDTIYPSLGTSTFQVVGEDLNGCISHDTIAVQVLKKGVLSAIPDVTVCDVNNHILSTTSSYIETYQWGAILDNASYELTDNAAYQGTNTDVLSISEIGPGTHNFYVQMEGLCGNELADTVLLTIHESTPIDALEDTTLCIHEDNSLFADIEGNNIVWNDGTLGQYVSPTSTGWYTVSFEEPNTGCQVADSMFVEMEDCIDNCVVVVPSGFSPNSDGVNDIFRSINTCDEGFSYYSLTIYDRWGGLVYQSDSAEEGWDGSVKGSKTELGVYVYNIAYTKELTNETEYIKGNVTLVH